MSHMGDKLTVKDLATLRRAMDLETRFQAGIFPRGAGCSSHFRRLERLGLLEFRGWGRDIDLTVDDDVRLFHLTDAGRRAASEPERLTPERIEAALKRGAEGAAELQKSMERCFRPPGRDLILR